MLKFWNYISNIGAIVTDTPDNVRKIHLINRLSLLGSVTTFIFAGHMILIESFYYFPFQIATGISTGLCLLFNSKRWYFFSIYWMFFTLLLNIFFCSFELQGTGVEYFMIPLGVIPFTVEKNKKICSLMVFLSMCAFFISYFLKKGYQPHMQISPINTEITFIIILFTTFLLCGIIIFQFKTITGKFEEIIQRQKDVVEIKNKEITDSINYAKRIQEAKLPRLDLIQSKITDCFILFKPKDIVSGDFYFFYERNNTCFIAAADCTGHGVPGAFMSMIGYERLEDAVMRFDKPSDILKSLNLGIKTSLKQSSANDSTRDGMDIAFCVIDKDKNKVSYAGANRPIWLIRKDTNLIEEIKATKHAIGGFTDDNQHFEDHELQLKKGDTFYLFSDGYADTFSEHGNKKLTTKKFKEILKNIQNRSMQEQYSYLDTFIEDWKGSEEQVDDILVIGIRV